MKIYLFICPGMLACWLLSPLTEKAGTGGHSVSVAADDTSSKKGLFTADGILDFVLKGNVRAVMNDREDNPKYHPLVLAYRNHDSTEVAIPVEVKTRGHFRKMKENCTHPPLQIKFPKDKKQLHAPFHGQTKLKLVMPCRGEEYVVREWLVYKLYNVVTEKSFRARLVRVTLQDEKSKKQASPLYGILLEEDDQLAKRNHSVSVTRKIKPNQTQREGFFTMAVFQYLIGNTDWSIQYMQNIKFLAKDSNAIAIPVPYDFDHAGIVSTPYAKPAEELQMSSVRERRYRGFCVNDIQVFDEVIADYNRLKKDIYAVYSGSDLIDSKYKKNTIEFLDDFYSTINNPVALKKDFLYPCDKNGTGNVVIKGLKEE